MDEDTNMENVISKRKIYELVISPVWEEIIKPAISYYVLSDWVALKTIEADELKFYQGKIAALQDFVDNIENIAEEVLEGSKDAE